jgi:hypothetical protein
MGTGVSPCLPDVALAGMGVLLDDEEGDEAAGPVAVRAAAGAAAGSEGGAE